MQNQDWRSIDFYIQSTYGNSKIYIVLQTFANHFKDIYSKENCILYIYQCRYKVSKIK